MIFKVCRLAGSIKKRRTFMHFYAGLVLVSSVFGNAKARKRGKRRKRGQRGILRYL